MANIETTISEAQMKRLRDYINQDCEMHLAAPHHFWHLDLGKLVAALEHAGIRVEHDGN
jgi:hypothetical protein